MPHPPGPQPASDLLVVARNRYNAKRTLRVGQHPEHHELVLLDVYNRQGRLALSLAMTPAEALDLATALTRA